MFFFCTYRSWRGARSYIRDIILQLTLYLIIGAVLYIVCHYVQRSMPCLWAQMCCYYSRLYDISDNKRILHAVQLFCLKCYVNTGRSSSLLLNLVGHNTFFGWRAFLYALLLETLSGFPFLSIATWWCSVYPNSTGFLYVTRIAICSLRDKAQVEQLLRYIVEEVPEDAERKRSFKYDHWSLEFSLFVNV